MWTRRKLGARIVSEGHKRSDGPLTKFFHSRLANQHYETINNAPNQRSGVQCRSCDMKLSIFSRSKSAVQTR